MSTSRLKILKFRSVYGFDNSKKILNLIDMRKLQNIKWTKLKKSVRRRWTIVYRSFVPKFMMNFNIINGKWERL